MNSENISIPITDEQKVVAKFFRPKTPNNQIGLLFLHGWTGRPNEDGAAVLAENGFYCLTISMRGHGESDGDIKTITSQDSLDDAIAAYDYLVKVLPTDSPIIAAGNSYGCFIAILLSEHRELAGLSLRAPAAYPDAELTIPKWGRGHEMQEITDWRSTAVNFTENKAFRLLHDFKGEIQILEAEKDEVVPHQTIENYQSAVADPDKLTYKSMKNWPHSMGTDPKRNEELQRVLLEWLYTISNRL